MVAAAAAFQAPGLPDPVDPAAFQRPNERSYWEAPTDTSASALITEAGSGAAAQIADVGEERRRWTPTMNSLSGCLLPGGAAPAGKAALSSREAETSSGRSGISLESR